MILPPCRSKDCDEEGCCVLLLGLTMITLGLVILTCVTFIFVEPYYLGIIPLAFAMIFFILTILVCIKRKNLKVPENDLI